MQKKLIAAMGLAIALSGGQQALAQEPTCDDLNWSAAVLSEYPDIADSCRGVYEKDGQMFAKVKIEVVRTRGNTMTFRIRHNDGSLGDSHTLTLPASWRANIGGRNFRASDLMRGQELNVYLPEDRFAFAVEDEDGLDEEDIVAAAPAAVAAMPTTASPLFLVGLAGGAFLALGGLMSGIRRRLS